ncbi:MAG: hypothetical protein WA406_09980 [Pseudolabrys sp.]
MTKADGFINDTSNAETIVLILSLMAKKLKTVALMTAEQANLLRRLAFDAYEPEAYSAHLTKAEAELRIEVLRAKMKLISEPPHTQ